MNMIAKLFADFKAILTEDFTVTGTLGTGPFARPLSDDRPHVQKIILSGDNKQTASLMLWYLLHDLAIDCGWTISQVETLRREFWQYAPHQTS